MGVFSIFSKPKKAIQHFLKPAPEVIDFANSASQRFIKLLAICDYHIDQMTAQMDSNESDTLHTKELISLTRTVLSLQKALDDYTLIVHPPIIDEESTTSSEKNLSIHSTPALPKGQTTHNLLIATKPPVPSLGQKGKQQAEQKSDSMELAKQSFQEWEGKKRQEIEIRKRNITLQIEDQKLSYREGQNLIEAIEQQFKQERADRLAAKTK
jgi:hypothetical protein